MRCRGTFSDNVINPTQANYRHVDLYRLGKSIVSKVRSEVDDVLTSVETGVQNAVLTAREKLVVPRVELAMKPKNAPTIRITC